MPSVIFDGEAKNYLFFLLRTFLFGCLPIDFRQGICYNNMLCIRGILHCRRSPAKGALNIITVVSRPGGFFLMDVLHTLLALSVALFAGLLMSRLTKIWNLPAVTAYLVAGILIGPYCLRAAGRSRSGLYLVGGRRKLRYHLGRGAGLHRLYHGQ